MLYLKKNKIAFLLSASIHVLVIVFLAIENKSSKPTTSMTVVDLVASIPSENLFDINENKNDSNSTKVQNRNFSKYYKVDDLKFKIKEIKKKKIKISSSQVKQIAGHNEDLKSYRYVEKNNSFSQDIASNSMSENIKTSAKYKIGTLKNPHPEYPVIARKKGWQGRLLLNVRISENGDVLNINILKTSGFKILDRTSVETIKEWKFTPARLGKNNVEGYLNIPISFKLIN